MSPIIIHEACRWLKQYQAAKDMVQEHEIYADKDTDAAVTDNDDADPAPRRNFWDLAAPVAKAKKRRGKKHRDRLKKQKAKSLSEQWP